MSAAALFWFCVLVMTLALVGPSLMREIGDAWRERKSVRAERMIEFGWWRYHMTKVAIWACALITIIGIATEGGR